MKYLQMFLNLILFFFLHLQRIRQDLSPPPPPPPRPSLIYNMFAQAGDWLLLTFARHTVTYQRPKYFASHTIFRILQRLSC